MDSILNNLNKIYLPSSLWGIHFNTKFVGIIHIVFNSDTIQVDKAIILTPFESSVKLSVFIEGQVAELPNLNYNINNVVDISKAINIVDKESGFCSKPISGSKSNELVFQNESKLKGAEGYKDESNREGKVKEVKEISTLCDICGKTFKGSGIESHLLTHQKEKPFKCKLCSKSFAKQYNLKTHEMIHSGERPFSCSECGKCYTSRSNLATHVKSTHSQCKQYTCLTCNMSFVHPRHRRIHMRKHTGERPFKCTTCNKTFSKNIHLTVHLRSHTGERPHICEICGKGFSTTGNLSAHHKSRHK